MTGNSNKLNGDIKQSNGSTTTVVATGDSNNIDFDVGNGADTGGSTTTLTIEGSSNDVALTQGSVSSATNANQTITVTGDQNKYTSKIEANDVTNVVAVTGDSNEFNILQNGQAGKNITLGLTGSGNQVNINQKSTQNVDSITVTSTSSNGNFTINQCNVGGC
jgi:hypothetical protein